MAISQKVGKGQFVHKVGRVAVALYKFWTKHTVFDFYTTTITKVRG